GDWVTVREGDSVFVGYDKTETETNILRYRKVSQKNKTFYQIVLSETPLYAEMGGQVGDRGTLTVNNETIEIFDTKKENNLSVHLTNSLPEDVTAPCFVRIDVAKRKATACNHTATHLLHEALREVLGKHVEQKGSFVSPESLRFDFSHFQKLTNEELRAVEKIANRKIRENYPLQESRNTPIAEAQAMGAMALFGEKYGETVRVIRFGSSIELCGGTHVQATGDIGMVRIISESSIAAGVRRIEAITGEAVEELMNNVQDTLNSARELFNNAPDLYKAIHKTLEENSELKKQVDNFMHERILTLRDKLIADAKDEQGIKVIRFRTDLPADAVKTLSFQIRNLLNEKLFVAITSLHEGKPSITVLLSDDLVAQGYNAVNITREAAKCIQGGGGGQPFFATAGGKNPEGLDKAMEMLKL
ncbi:MAG TPA: alanine--tRNA ligase-related protein, partial [Paludibacteraceae bacterium]|nr:alanine--tRNA ligase-related protein [Paludibacteraceae bacterium]